MKKYLFRKLILILLFMLGFPTHSPMAKTVDFDLNTVCNALQNELGIDHKTLETLGGFKYHVYYPLVGSAHVATKRGWQLYEYDNAWCMPNFSCDCSEYEGTPGYVGCSLRAEGTSSISVNGKSYQLEVNNCTCPDGTGPFQEKNCPSGIYNPVLCQCETCAGCATGASTCPCRVNQQCGCCPWVVDQYNQPVIDENGNKVRMFYVGNGWCSRCIIGTDGVYVDALYGRADDTSNKINDNGPIDCCPPWARIQYKASDTYSSN